MQVHKGLDNLPEFKNPVLTIGSFDGVHQGHRAIINRLREKAKEVDGESVILTFHPHPREVVFPNDHSLRLLTTLEEKISLLGATHVDHLIIIPFTVEFSQINPYRYVDEFLIKKVRVKHLIIGYDHKFGLNREGDIDLLKIYERQEKFTVEEIPRKDVDHLRVSSTKIRNYLLAGNIDIANAMLGSTYILSGKIGKGSQLAGKLGYPTANCVLSESKKLIPAPGTYAAKASCDGVFYEGMLYIGTSPTLQSREKVHIEMNLFADIQDELYGKEISIFPEKKIRSDVKFRSKQELIYNIKKDKDEVLLYFDKKDYEISTVILNYNGKHHLEKYISSHFERNNSHVVVVDNASSDGSVEFLENEYPSVQNIKLKENFGFAGGYNEGIQKIGSKYIAIVNSDIQVTKDWMAPIIRRFESDPSIAVIQPKILSLEKKSQFEYAGAAGGYMDKLGYPFCRGRMLSTVEDDQGQYDEAVEIFWASGAAMVIKAELFKKADGFDSEFFAHMEEIDLCWRLKNAGYKIFYEPESVVYHLGGGTLSYESPKKVFLNLRNNYWMILRNKSMSSLFWQIPVRIMMDSMYCLSLLLKLKVAHFASALKGILLGVTRIFSNSQYRKQQKYFLKRYRIGGVNKKGLKSIILPFEYYLLGKKKFNQLK